MPQLLQQGLVLGFGRVADVFEPFKELLCFHPFFAEHEGGEKFIGVGQSKLVSQLHGLADAFTVSRHLCTCLPGLPPKLPVRIACHKLRQFRAREVTVPNLVPHCVFVSGYVFHNGGQLFIIRDLCVRSFLEEEVAPPFQQWISELCRF